MNFLVDQQLPKALAIWIGAQGHTADHLRALGLEHADDIEIWREARARGAVIVSKDEDFSVIVRAQSGPPVVWLRLGNCSNARLLRRVADTWPSIIAELEAGALLVEVR